MNMGTSLYGFPLGFRLGGPPLTLFEVLVVSVPNALFWAIVLYALYRLGSWTLNLFGLEVTIGRKRS